jgi:hypothetical protein
MLATYARSLKLRCIWSDKAVVADPRIAHGALRTLDEGLELAIPIRLKHRQGAAIIEAPGDPATAVRVDRALVRAITLARTWAQSLAKGEIPSTKHLARHHGICERYAGRLMPLAWLAPDLVETLLAGKQPPAVSLGALTRQPIPMDWDAQRRLFAAMG